MELPFLAKAKKLCAISNLVALVNFTQSQEAIYEALYYEHL
jgi:hypothetical protein